jgi:hypothetical protein
MIAPLAPRRFASGLAAQQSGSIGFPKRPDLKPHSIEPSCQRTSRPPAPRPAIEAAMLLLTTGEPRQPA